MTDTYDRRRPTEHARDYVARNFTPKTIGSLVLAIVLFTVALMMICLSAGHVEPHFAVYAAGLTFAACGFVMMIGWGASSGHGSVAICTATELERRAREIDKQLFKQREEFEGRLDEILANQRRLAEILTAGVQNDLARRRSHN